jgi:hypothetical protein
MYVVRLPGWQSGHKACLDGHIGLLVAGRGCWHAVGMADEDARGPYLEAIRQGFNFAREVGSGCRPVHFLVGIAAGDGAAAGALSPGEGVSLRDAVVSASSGAMSSAGYLHMQVQEAARSFAADRHQQPSPEHLLVALIDQGDPEVLTALSLAGLDRGRVRRAALIAVGATGDEPAIAIPAPTPAGTLDRPPLPTDQLDSRAWTVLRWRQDHLPLHRVRGASDAQALSHLERSAVWQLADQLQLDEDQRYSLTHHHVREVERRAGIDRPARAGAGRGPGTLPVAAALTRSRPRHRHPALLNVTVGWAAWLGNRRVSVRDRWFRLRTAGDYRDSPQP